MTRGRRVASLGDERARAATALRDSEVRWQYALEGSGDGVWDWDVPTHTVFFSRRWKEMLGYAEHDIGSDLDEWRRRVHPDDRAMVTELVEKHLRGETPQYVCEHRVLCKNGTYKWILDRGKVLVRDADGRPLRVVGTHGDVTERRRLESELRAAQEQLEQRVSERTAELRAANQALRSEIAERHQVEEALREAKQAAEAADEAKSEFLSMMSHELRTPLNIIVGYTQLLAEGSLKPLEDEQAEVVQRIHRCAVELVELVSAVLDFRRFEVGRLSVEAEAVEVDALLRELRDEIGWGRQRTSVELHWQVAPDLPTLCTDPGKLKMIVKNLVGNAIKFTERGSIRVEARRDSDAVLISTADTGIGIPPDELAAIFQPFYQVKHDQRVRGGTGLGLYIVQRTLGLLGGRIEVDSEVGHGSVFRVWIPSLAGSPARQPS